MEVSMSEIRRVRRIVTGKNAIDGAGVRLVRVIGNRDTAEFDPFLLLDAFDSRDPQDYIKGFPWHPHRGIETITYLVRGVIEHGDSLGNRGSILDGDCQWMTAGSGIIHQEMPKASERLLGVQIWLNLPAMNKMADPQYGDIKSEDVGLVNDGATTVRIIAGEYKGVRGAFEGNYVKATYLDVEVVAGGEWSLDCERDATVFIYILQGKGYFDQEDAETIAEKHAVLFDGGDKFWVRAGNEGIRFLLLSGRPLKEPIAWGGPIVMNTAEELELAFRELRENTFVKKTGAG
jgi:hypothetical protein